MNYNVLSYIIYAIITIYVTVIVGYKFHKNGLVFILELCEDKETGTAINNVLLILYYCFNIGYCILLIPFWETVNTGFELVSSIGTKAGSIIFLLAIMPVSYTHLRAHET